MIRTGGTCDARRLAVALAMTVAASASAGTGRIWSDGTTSDPQQIDAVLATIPMTDRDMGYANLGERLKQLGMRVESINAGAFSADDLRRDRTLRKGDVSYFFSTTPPNNVVAKRCPISARFHLVRRGAKWLPQDRTGNFLINGWAHCRPPQP